MIHQGRDLGVRIGLDKAAAELVAIADPDQPGVVFSTRMAERQQLLQQHRHLDPVGRAQRIELQRVLADGQLLVMGGAGDRTIDIGKGAAAFGHPFPDLGWCVGRCLIHMSNSVSSQR